MTTTSGPDQQPQIHDVTTATFTRDVLERSHELPVLVDFWAGWCGPCRALTPQLERAVRAHAGDVALAKVDVDAEQQLAQRYRISGIPHVKLFRRGREVDGFVGVRSAQAIEAFLAQHLGPSAFEQLLAEHRDAGRFADAVAALGMGYHDQAFDHLLRAVRDGEGEQREQARAFMVAAFEHVGSDHPSVQRYRRQLASTLY